MFDIAACRKDFPVLGKTIYGKPLVYLDNAATTQVPKQVLEAFSEHYEQEHANVHRGIHYLSERSTQKLEEARCAVQRFLGACYVEEIIFTQGTTDGINLVAGGMAREIREGDEIVVSMLEHHSNFVPWQQLCLRNKAKLRIAPAPDGEIDLEAFAAMLTKRTKMVALTQVSNLTGSVLPLRQMIAMAREKGIPVLVDGAQGIRHEQTDVLELDCDFYCFSGHKMLAPTGIGVLYGKKERLEALTPVRFGGGMVDVVTREHTTFAPLPARLEAGTPNFAGAIALAAAVRYLEEKGLRDIGRREAELLAYTEQKLQGIDGLHILGSPRKRSGAISFGVDDIHSYDLASILDKMGIAVRSGSHCAQVALQEFSMTEATRVSPAFYNTAEEIDVLAEGVRRAGAMLRKWRKTR